LRSKKIERRLNGEVSSGSIQILAYNNFGVVVRLRWGWFLADS
jgi:hypothetical protein